MWPLEVCVSISESDVWPRQCTDCSLRTVSPFGKEDFLVDCLGSNIFASRVLNVIDILLRQFALWHVTTPICFDCYDLYWSPPMGEVGAAIHIMVIHLYNPPPVTSTHFQHFLFFQTSLLLMVVLLLGVFLRSIN